MDAVQLSWSPNIKGVYWYCCLACQSERFLCDGERTAALLSSLLSLLRASWVSFSFAMLRDGGAAAGGCWDGTGGAAVSSMAGVCGFTVDVLVVVGLTTFDGVFRAASGGVGRTTLLLVLLPLSTRGVPAVGDFTSVLAIKCRGAIGDVRSFNGPPTKDSSSAAGLVVACCRDDPAVSQPSSSSVDSFTSCWLPPLLFSSSCCAPSDPVVVEPDLQLFRLVPTSFALEASKSAVTFTPCSLFRAFVFPFDFFGWRAVTLSVFSTSFVTLDGSFLSTSNKAVASRSGVDVVVVDVTCSCSPEKSSHDSLIIAVGGEGLAPVEFDFRTFVGGVDSDDLLCCCEGLEGIVTPSSAMESRCCFFALFFPSCFNDAETILGGLLLAMASYSPTTLDTASAAS